MLIGSRLFWYRSAGDGEPRGFIGLENSIIRRTKEFRFQILDNSNTTRLDDTRLFNRELRAESEAAMLEWIGTLQEAIEYAAQQQVQQQQIAHQRVPTAVNLGDIAAAAAGTAAESGVPMPGASPEQSVAAWLSELRLGFLTPSFLQRGYTDMQLIQDVGLSDEDLDVIGVTLPLHRRMLKTAAQGQFSPTLQVTVPDWRDFGSVITYKVIARFHFARSCIYVRFSDLNRLISRVHQAIESAASASGAATARSRPGGAAATAAAADTLASQLPPLPGKGMKVIQDQRDPAFVSQRRLAIEDFLRSMATALQSSPHSILLLQFLGLTPPTVGSFV